MTMIAMSVAMKSVRDALWAFSNCPPYSML